MNDKTKPSNEHREEHAKWIESRRKQAMDDEQLRVMNVEDEKAGFTPGPWFKTYENDGNGHFTQWFDVGPAKVFFHGNDEIEEAEANANLIAAAPDLLEALKVICPPEQADFNDIGECCWCDEGVEGEQCTSNICPGVLARAAIAKAQGK